MAETLVLEANQSNADTVNTNGDYIVHFAEAPFLNPGDQLSLRMASIDSQKSDSNSIVLPTDTAVSIHYSYYDCDYDTSGKKEHISGSAWSTPTYTLYTAYTDQRILKLISVTYTCPDYRPPAGGDPGVPVLVQPLFSWIDNNGIAQVSKPNFFEDPFAYVGEAGAAYGINDNRALCVQQKTAIEYREGSLTIIGVNAEKNFPFPVNTKVTYDDGSLVYSVVSAATANILTGTTGTVLKAGRYDRNTLAVALTKGFTEVPIDASFSTPDQLFIPDSRLVYRSDNTAYENAIYHPIPEDQGDISLNDNCYVYDGVKVQVGARKFAVEYGLGGSVFQLSAAHTSVYNSASPGDENVAFFTSGTAGVDLRYHQVSTATGIMIHDMLPRSFWDDTLALYQNVVVPLNIDSCGNFYYTIPDATGKYPKESSTITVFTASNNRYVTDPPTTLPVYINTTDTPTNAVVGDSPLVSFTGGYYLVEVTGINAYGNYIDNGQNRASIMGIVSLQYNSDDIITGYADSGVPYVHRGFPVQISSARIRILDPQTKEVVNTLGPNNAIFLDLVKAFPPALPAPEVRRSAK